MFKKLGAVNQATQTVLGASAAQCEVAFQSTEDLMRGVLGMPISGKPPEADAETAQHRQGCSKGNL